ncbi:hypothetical protein L2E82_45266 [Cichorium intybus]|uniref:Uncharacterized protein n=1 Tax=Cichorium intybus TaxID=13427 RepID=A0ACB8ZWW4_CICIN|nr:hypothetical protein L2E82_45266 [Cichorium intybus]
MLELIVVTSPCALVVAPYEVMIDGVLGRRKPQLVLLDHGLYTELDVATRTNYAALWKGLVLADVRAIKENCMKLGAGEDLYALFAGIPTMSPWNRVIDPTVDHLAIQRNASDQSELQMYASLPVLECFSILDAYDADINAENAIEDQGAEVNGENAENAEVNAEVIYDAENAEVNGAEVNGEDEDEDEDEDDDFNIDDANLSNYNCK